ncbi:hypothetical protein [Kitasatospora sp. NPDC004531]
MRRRIPTAGAALAAALPASGCTAAGTDVTAATAAGPGTTAPTAEPPPGEAATPPSATSPAPAVSPSRPTAPASTRTVPPTPSAPTPSAPPSFAAPHVSAIRVDGPCGLNGHTYEADFVITLAGGQGWRIKPQSAQRVRPDGTSLVYRYGVLSLDWPPPPASLVDGKFRVGYPLSDDGLQVIALADGSVHGIVVPADLRATIDCTP